MAACGKAATEPVNNDETLSSTSTAASDSTIDRSTSEPVSTQTNTAADTVKTDASTGNSTAEINGQILQSAAVDLDGDGISEQVEALQITKESTETGAEGELEGILRIKSAGRESRITFWNKPEGLTGLLTSMEFEDLDGDGAKDVFIIVPDNGASFSISNYFIYSYKNNKSYTFTSDDSLVEFIAGFKFKSSGGNILSISNSRYNFTADLAIEFYDGQEQTDETMGDYEQNTWIEPVPVDISDTSRLALVKDKTGKPELKVPLPVFGLATVDMIGEIDLYYTVDSSFKPVLKRFVVMDLRGNKPEKVGSCEIKGEKD